MVRSTFNHRSVLAGRHQRWLIGLAFIMGLAGMPEIVSATPLHIPMEEDGGGDVLPPGLGNEHVAIQLFGDVFSRRLPHVCPLLMAASAITHTPAGNFEGPDGFERYVAEAWSAFPQATFVIADSIAGTDLVTLRWTMTGRHLEAFGEQPATGAEVKLEGLAILRFEGGMIAETWLQYDRMALVEQIEDVPVVPEVCPPCDLP
jgi:predicted ester cyclase